MYGNGVSNTDKGRTLCDKSSSVCGDSVYASGLVPLIRFVVLVVLFPMPYLDYKGPLYLRSCQKGAEM
jgi:hypothetical protein